MNDKITLSNASKHDLKKYFELMLEKNDSNKTMKYLVKRLESKECLIRTQNILIEDLYKDIDELAEIVDSLRK